MSRIFVKPKSGLIVRDPKNMQPLPSEGLFVEKSTYWIRRAKDGDVSILKKQQK